MVTLSPNLFGASSATESQAREDSENPKVFVLKRELSEVHLLLDNLSANPDKCLSEASKHLPDGVPSDWIERICQINWPPTPSPADQTQEAALLVRAKDYLNTLTSPASGASIAFTLLVTQEDNTAPEVSKAGVMRRSAAPTRHSLAQNAYPGLIRKAAEFRLVMIGLSAVLCLFLVITCLLSWYTAFGNATLSQRAAAQVTLDLANKRITDAENGVGLAPEAGKPGPGPLLAITAPDKPVIHLCDRGALLPPVMNGTKALKTFSSVSEMQACDAEHDAKRSIHAIDRTIAAWLQLIPGQRADDVDNSQWEIYASSIVNILGTAILPVLYGVLGAGAAVLRGISRKIKRSQLAPRDLHLSLQQLALGAVMGACIGLFIAQPTASGQATPGLIGTVALSSAALSFIAGFGVEQVFAALEALIGRIFLIGGAPPPSASAK